MILERIVARKRQEVAELKAKGLEPLPMEVEPPRGFIAAVTGYDGISLIAEAKKASPSKGVICADFDPVAIADRYERGGAQALSVLTDEDFFQGSLAFIPAVRAAVSLPVLRKDFIIDEIQISQARNFGADAVLLIAAILDSCRMRDYLDLSHELGMDCLVEVHDEREAELAIESRAALLGVNNRDLRDFSVSLETSIRVRKMIPPEITVVSESGIKTVDDVRRLADHGIGAVLVGETLMRAADQAGAIAELLGRG